jgi:purine-nucleoside phosphorylase
MPQTQLPGLAQAASKLLRDRLALEGNIAAFVQTGSGFDLQNLLDETLASLPLNELPGMPDLPSPAGHPLRVTLGRCGTNLILLCEGRRHLYEGLGMVPCVLPVCAAAHCGIRKAIFLCAAGGIREDLKPGALVAVTDYINNLGTSPLCGNQTLGTTPFPDMTEAFSQALISDFINTVAESGLEVRLGTYQANLGPQYETPAEIFIAARNGADLVGMSLVPETIAARALGLEVMGLALVTNPAASQGGRPLSHQEVAETGRLASRNIARGLRDYLAQIQP